MEKINKLTYGVSPFLLLLIPFFIAIVFTMTAPDLSQVHDQVQLKASFFQLPDFLQVKSWF